MKTIFLKYICSLTLLLFVAGYQIGVQAQTQLTADEFESKLKATPKAQLIDVRTPEEYRDGHLQQSKNVNYKASDFDSSIKSLDKSQPVFVYCLSGGRSAAAAKKLAENGFTEVYDMKGGYLKWSSAGKDVAAPASPAANGMAMTDFKKLTVSSKIVLVDFYAKWCAPCIKMLPTVNKLKSEYKERAKIETIDYDANKSLAKELGIDEIPAFLLYKNGKLVTRKNGLLTEKEFRELLDSNL